MVSYGHGIEGKVVVRGIHRSKIREGSDVDER